MQNPLPFGEILEAADDLPVEDQEALIAILKNRLRERRRTELLQDIHEAEKEFCEGKCQPASPDEIMREILS